MPPREPVTDATLRVGLNALRRRRWVIVVSVVGLVGAALALSFVQSPTYEARGKILLASSTSESVIDAIGSDRSGGSVDEVVATEIQVMQSAIISDAVREELGRTPRVSLEGLEGTSVVQVTARGGSAQEVEETVNTFARVYIETRRQTFTEDLDAAAERIQENLDVQAVRVAQLRQPAKDIQDQIDALPPAVPGAPEDPQREALIDQRDQAEAQAQPQITRVEAQIADNEADLSQIELARDQITTGGAQLVSPATRPNDPVSPNPVRNGLLAAVLGLAIGIALAFLLETLDDTLRTKEDLEDITQGRAVMGLIPVVPGWRDRSSTRIVSIEDPTSPVSEAYRTLRTSVQFLGVDRPAKILQITSPSPGEGKTTTVANLGVAFARAGQQVAIVCCDLRRPRIEQFFGTAISPGFTSIIVGDATFEEAVRPVEDEPRLWVLASGPPPPNPSELLSTRRAREVLEELGRRFDIVLIDAPPVLPVTDALLLANLVDATILVTSAGRTSKRGTRRALELLDQVDAEVEGTVLNYVSGTDSYGASSGYGYGYRYESAGRRKVVDPDAGARWRAAVGSRGDAPVDDEG
ncbi:MAG TPA: polysaccharide biosynthesis tyrosine autokinase [Iamia sp.]